MDTDTGIERWPCDDGGRHWSDASTGQGMPQIVENPEVRRGLEQIRPQSPRGRMALLTP